MTDGILRFLVVDSILIDHRLGYCLLRVVVLVVNVIESPDVLRHLTAEIFRHAEDVMDVAAHIVVQLVNDMSIMLSLDLVQLLEVTQLEIVMLDFFPKLLFIYPPVLLVIFPF